MYDWANSVFMTTVPMVFPLFLDVAAGDLPRSVASARFAWATAAAIVLVGLRDRCGGPWPTTRAARRRCWACSSASGSSPRPAWASSSAATSAEMFGFFGVFDRFGGAMGISLFGFVVLATGPSRPAIPGLSVFFVIGGRLLSRVDVARGRRATREAEARAA